jgi:hypothetical protein
MAFLPPLTAEGFSPIREWRGHEKLADGAITMRWPKYEQAVSEFFRAAGQDCWMDFDYVPAEAGRMLEDPDFVRRASLDELKTMLTYCVRGERFCDGHWGAMVEQGHVRRLLERLKGLRGDGRRARLLRESVRASWPSERNRLRRPLA